MNKEIKMPSLSSLKTTLREHKKKLKAIADELGTTHIKYQSELQKAKSVKQKILRVEMTLYTNYAERLEKNCDNGRKSYKKCVY